MTETQGRGRAVLLAALAWLGSGGVACAAETVITQKDRAFTPNAVELQPGDTLKINNDDDFVHHAYVDSKAMSFDSDELEPGQSITIKFPDAGTFPVRCHIHPKMLLTVTVK